MISLLEGPLSDEPIFSFVGRLSAGLPKPSRPNLGRYLLGKGGTSISVDFPGQIDALVTAVGQRLGMTAEDFIYGHTIFPLVSPFYDQEESDRILATMRRSSRPTMGGRLKRNHWDDQKVPLRFCPQCRIHDIARGSSSWWRRLHQIPRIFCCPEHGCALAQSQFDLVLTRRLNFPLVETAEAIETPFIPDAIDRVLANDVRWLLTNPQQPFCRTALLDLYREKLRINGYLKGGRLKRDDFLQEFHRQRSRHDWELRGLAFDPLKRASWPAKTAKLKKSTRSAIMHLLVMRFLGINIAQDYAELRPNSTRRTVAAPAKKSLEIEQYLRKYWSDRGKNTLTIVAELQIGASHVRKIASRLGLLTPRFGTIKQIIAYRRKRMEVRRLLALSRRRGESPSHRWSKWSSRNDTIWYERWKLRKNRRPYRTLVDWRVREEKSIARLPVWVAQIKGHVPLWRVTKNRLIKHMPGGSTALRDLLKMPKLRLAIDAVSESVEDFVLRRVLEIKRQHPGAPCWVIREKAAVDRKCRDPRILDALGYYILNGKWLQRLRPANQ